MNMSRATTKYVKISEQAMYLGDGASCKFERHNADMTHVGKCRFEGNPSGVSALAPLLALERGIRDRGCEALLRVNEKKVRYLSTSHIQYSVHCIYLGAKFFTLKPDNTVLK